MEMNRGSINQEPLSNKNDLTDLKFPTNKTQEFSLRVSFLAMKERLSLQTCNSKINPNGKVHFSERVSVYSELNFSKDFLNEHVNNINSYTELDNIKGSLLMIVASLLVAIIFGLQKVLFTKFSQISYQQQNLVRGCTMAALNFIHGKLNNETFLYDDFRTNITVFRRILCGFSAEIILYFSTNYLRINTASTFYILFGVVCSIMSCVILKEKLSKKELLIIYLCFLSSCLIIKPFFGSGQDTFTGFILGILSIIFLSVTVILHKLLNGNIGTYIIYFWYGIFYIVEATLSYLMTNTQFYWTWEILAYLVILGALCSYTNYIYILAINSGNVSYVLPFESTNVVFSLILGFFVLGENCDFLDWVGTFGIITLCFYRSYIKIQELKFPETDKI